MEGVATILLISSFFAAVTAPSRMEGVSNSQASVQGPETMKSIAEIKQKNYALLILNKNELPMVPMVLITELQLALCTSQC